MNGKSMSTDTRPTDGFDARKVLREANATGKTAGAAISVRELFRSYGKTSALSGVSFDVAPGEIFGVVGPDGAGKTTLFRILTTLLVPDSGFASIDGLDTVRDWREIRRRVGYVPGRFSLYQDLTVRENIDFFATVFGTTVEANYDLVADIYRQIEPFADRRAGALSGGMKQKLALSCALIHRPRVLFLDEPTTGVDPVSRKEFWEMLARLKAGGMTIVVATPYMDEAGLCDRVALMRGGRFLGVDTPERVREGFADALFAVSASAMFRLLTDLRSFPGTLHAYTFGEFHHATLRDRRDGLDPPEGTGALKAYLAARDHTEVVVREIPAGIEDCFMALSDSDQDIPATEEGNDTNVADNTGGVA